MALLAVTSTLAGCDPAPESTRSPGMILISGDTQGWIVPCGCASNQSGGMPRRATHVHQTDQTHELLVLDCGGAPAGDSPYDRLRFEAILRGEKALGIAAHNLGAAELALGPSELADIARRSGIPFVSTNVRLDDDRDPPWLPHRVVKLAARSVAVLGVLDPTLAAPGFAVEAPVDAILREIARVRADGGANIYLVLAYAEAEALDRLALALPEVDLVVGGPTGQPIAPRRVGQAWLSSATNKGKFLLEVPLASLGRDQAPATETSGPRIVELGATYADDDAQVAIVHEFRRQLAQRDFTAHETSFAPRLPDSLPEGYAVAGSDACKSCHEEAFRLWQHSAHAQAWRSLAEKGAEVDPECQRCHTTGYGQPGGFVSLAQSANRLDVGCESCHGPSAAHVADPNHPTVHRQRARHGCVTCHDRENSPHFDYDPYWDRIRHGLEANPEERP